VWEVKAVDLKDDDGIIGDALLASRPYYYFNYSIFPDVRSLRRQSKARENLRASSDRISTTMIHDT
jgi:hypothetical protein